MPGTGGVRPVSERPSDDREEGVERPAEDPVDALLHALRALPDDVLRDVEPATAYVPELEP
jgi:hypothetical protein